MRNRTGQGVGQEGPRPIVEKKAAIALQADTYERTFETVAREWIVSNAHWSEYYTNQVTSYLEKDVSPDWQVADQQHQGLHICAPSSRMWRLVAQDCGDPHPPVVWANLQLCGCPRSLQNTILPPCSKGLVKRPQVRHNPPLTWAEIPDFLNRGQRRGYQTTVLALKLMALTYVRTVELRKASWEEFDLDNAMWSIPSERMKKKCDAPSGSPCHGRRWPLLGNYML